MEKRGFAAYSGIALCWISVFGHVADQGTDPTSTYEGADAVRIAMLAPPWIPVPAPDYGGIEEVVRLLTQGLVSRGHDVTLFAAPGSVSDAAVVEVLEEAQPDNIEDSLIEATYVGAVFDRLDAARRAGRPFDVVHDHSPAVALAMADRNSRAVRPYAPRAVRRQPARALPQPGAQGDPGRDQRGAAGACPRGRPCRFVVPNPIDLDEWPYSDAAGDGLIFVGRMDPDKGPDRAIAAANLAGRKLTLAGPIQPDSEEYFKSRGRAPARRPADPLHRPRGRSGETRAVRDREPRC